MITTDDFVKRLEQIFEFYEQTPSSFADKIGVQRSSLSHLLSGRNKPSLDLILKIIAAFPEVDLYWILLGKGNLNNKKKEENDSPTLSNKINSEANKEANFAEVENNNPKTTSEKEEQIVKKDHDEIKNIIIFYKDGTFKNFTH